MTGAEGVPQTELEENVFEVFSELPWGTWEEAKLLPCLRYLRGNKGLHVPEPWLKVFPEIPKQEKEET